MNRLVTFQHQRQLIQRAAESVPEQLWLEVPPGFNNNIAWNLGHLITVQQAFTYRLSGLEMLIDPSYLDLFAPGTSPEDWSETPDISRLLGELGSISKQVAEDYEAGRFDSFQQHTTSTGLRLNHVDEAIAFNNFHEGIHAGIMLTLARCLRAGHGS